MPQTIKQRYDGLSKQDLTTLLCAFENTVPQYIKVEDGKVFGVHLDKDPTLKIVEAAGFWSVAERIKK